MRGRAGEGARAQLLRLPASQAMFGSPPHALMPPCAPCALPLPPCLQGFQAQGNEFSYFMLLAGAYLLNGVEREEQWALHPWGRSLTRAQT